MITSVKLFVWDFHGVLEKDNELGVLEISNKVLEQEGFKESFTDDDNRNLYGRRWYEYFEYLLPRLSREEHLALQAACFHYAEENLHVLKKHIKPNDYTVDVLKAIKRAKHDQILLSNSRPSDLEWFINAVGLKKFFPKDKMFGVNTHERKGAKKEVLESYMQGKQFDVVVCIGDSQADMELAKVTGGVSYFYTHPHVTPTNKPIKADYLITDLRTILQEV